MNTISNVNNLYISYSIKLFSNFRENKNIYKNISKKEKVRFFPNGSLLETIYFYTIIFSL